MSVLIRPDFSAVFYVKNYIAIFFIGVSLLPCIFPHGSLLYLTTARISQDFNHQWHTNNSEISDPVILWSRFLLTLSWVLSGRCPMGTSNSLYLKLIILLPILLLSYLLTWLMKLLSPYNDKPQNYFWFSFPNPSLFSSWMFLIFILRMIFQSTWSSWFSLALLYLRPFLSFRLASLLAL